MPTAELSEPLLLTVDGAAYALGIGRTKMYELLDVEIPTVHIGRALRIPARAIREYAERLEAEQRESTTVR